MGTITVAAFFVVFLLLWGRIFYHFHTHKDALSSIGLDGFADSLFVKLLLSFVAASFIAILAILAGEFALEMIFAYWYVTAIMAGLMTLAITENGRKTAIVAGISAVIGICGNYFINAGLDNSMGSQNHQASQATQKDSGSSGEAGQSSGKEQHEQQQEQASEAQQGDKPQKPEDEKKSNESHTKEKKKHPSSNEVSLGSISIGASKDTIQESLGKEIEANHKETSAKIRYRYTDADIITNSDDIVIEFISNSNKLATPRGIKQGSSLDDVLRMYGNPAAQSEREGGILYEYHLTSTDHKPCLLRFAIRNSQVDYISGILLE